MGGAATGDTPMRANTNETVAASEVVSAIEITNKTAANTIGTGPAPRNTLNGSAIHRWMLRPAGVSTEP
jgi:hypothetical protein